MISDDLIFDLGFHNGDDTGFYLAKGFRVVAVEANPELVKDGLHRFNLDVKAVWLFIAYLKNIKSVFCISKMGVIK